MYQICPDCHNIFPALKQFVTSGRRLLLYLVESEDFRTMAEEGCRLFVYGVGENTRREELEDEFGRFGTVTPSTPPTSLLSIGRAESRDTSSSHLACSYSCLQSRNGKEI